MPGSQFLQIVAMAVTLLWPTEVDVAVKTAAGKE